jgi:putative FmdB family regulatory protein
LIEPSGADFREGEKAMPTYEYQCDACEHNFDEFQSMFDEPLKKCPKCGKNKLRRVFGAGAAVLFKGSGFYQTDYRSESYKSAAKKEQEAAKPAGTGGTDGKTGSGSKAGKEGGSSAGKK